MRSITSPPPPPVREPETPEMRAEEVEVLWNGREVPGGPRGGMRGEGCVNEGGRGRLALARRRLRIGAEVAGGKAGASS